LATNLREACAAQIHFTSKASAEADARTYLQLWRILGVELAAFAEADAACQNPPHDADGRMDCCNHCKQELIDIDSRGERLTGCLSCNLWSASGEKLWITLSKEDLNALALHHLRHGGSAKQMPKPHRSS
jgi:hypothetical protein